jgi:translation elongation factor EF-G
MLKLTPNIKAQDVKGLKEFVEEIVKSYLEKEDIDIEKLRDCVNKSFHSSNTKFEHVLWKELFPLVENIVSKGRSFE